MTIHTVIFEKIFNTYSVGFFESEKADFRIIEQFQRKEYAYQLCSHLNGGPKPDYFK